jgi:hypothetical protein
MRLIHSRRRGWSLQVSVVERKHLALMAVAALLEVLQALTPDHSSYFVAAF